MFTRCRNFIIVKDREDSIAFFLTPPEGTAAVTTIPEGFIKGVRESIMPYI
jgi:hypothetical protein